MRGAATRDQDGRTSGRDAADGMRSFWKPIPQDSAAEEATALGGLRGGAGALPYQAELERSLGADLSGVSAYTGPQAKQAADALGAQAYAMRGEQAVVFGDSAPSKELVAHEVVHTLQLGGTGAVSQDESEADAIGARAAAGECVEPGAIKSGGGKVRKKEKPFAEMFEAFLRGKESADTSRFQFGATAHATVAHDSGLVEQLSSSATGEQTGIGAYRRESETTLVIGRTDPLQELASTIGSARRYARMESGKTRLRELNAVFALARLMHEREALDAEALDPALVAGKASALDAQIGEAHQEIRRQQDQRLAFDRLVVTLDTEEQQLPTAHPDDVAKRLALAEQILVTEAKLTQKRVFDFDLLAGKLEHGRSTEVEATERGQTRQVTDSDKTTYQLGGGAGRTREQSRATTTHGTTRDTTVSTEQKLMVDGDGNVGVGGGQTLAKSIEGSHGKATGTTGYSGSVTTNIIELPAAEGSAPRYAVVVTINLGVALSLGVEKQMTLLEKKHGTGENAAVMREGVKSKLGLTVKGGVSAELTQTHILDEQGVKLYLASLDAAGTDEATAQQQPELGILYKAVNGLGAAEELVAGAAAMFASSSAAQMLKVDESVELTTKLDGSVSASAAAGIGSLGAGAGGSLYRTMKIARVATPKGERVEIKVVFGDTANMHGALSASALGVTLSAATKAWTDGLESVTFRLDDTAPEYAYLYDEIVLTKSRSELVALRDSARFRQHAYAYNTKSGTGQQDTGGWAANGVSLADTQGRHATEEMGMDAGGLTAKVAGAQWSELAVGLGPLDALKRKQTDAATFEIRDGMSMLDLSETTESSWLGKLDVTQDSLIGLVTSESPIAGVQQMLTETKRQLDGFFLDPEDIAVIVDKAVTEPAAWANVPARVELPRDLLKGDRRGAWEVLRRELADPNFAQLPGVPWHLSRDLAHGRAVCKFMTAGDRAKGLDYLRVVLRNWRVVGGMDGTAGATMYEFPEGLDPTVYRDVRRSCMGLGVALQAFVPDRATGAERGLAHVTEVQCELARVIKVVETTTGFARPRAQAEMLAELHQLATEIPVARRDFLRQCSGEPSVDQLVGDVGADAKSKVHHLEATLAGFRAPEKRILTEARAMREWTRLSERKRYDRLEQLHAQCLELYELWVALGNELRFAYTAAGVAESDWKVSQRGELVNKSLDPNSATASTLLVDEYFELAPHRYHLTGEAQTRRDNWDKRYVYY